MGWPQSASPRAGLAKENDELYLATHRRGSCIRFEYRVDGRAVSCVEGFLFRGRGEKQASLYIHNVRTEAEFAGRGCATSLLHEAVKMAEALNCFKVFAVCADDLQKFYEKAGFKHSGLCMKVKL